MDRVEESNERADDAPTGADEQPAQDERPSDADAPAEDEAATPEAAEPQAEPEVLTPDEIAALQAKAAEAEALAEKLERAQAEFMNETKRIRRKAEQDRKYAIEKVVVDLLPVVDALNSAAEGLGDDEAAAPMREGLALVEGQMQQIFERHGIAPIEALDQPFDPARHQAIMMVEDPAREPQTVCQVLRVGYELNGRVVRPAEVLVVKAPPAPASEEAAEQPEADGGEAAPADEESA